MIKDMLMSEETLFRNEDVFNPDYIPESIVYRDSQIRELVLSLKPAMRGGKAGNCFLLGPPATGKTTCAKLVMNEMKSKNLIAVHVNCQVYDTPFKVFSEIHKNIFGFRPAETGIPLTAVYDKIFSFIEREKKVLLVILDELDRLFLKNLANDVLYRILRAYETHPEARTCVWSVSARDDMHRLDDKVRSVFTPAEIKFAKYTVAEMKGILKGRRDAGLYRGVVSDEILDLVCENAKDMRDGIESLRRAVIAAESEAVKRVEERHIKFSIKNENAVTKDEGIIRKALENGPLDSGTLFESTGMSYAKFYRNLKKMEASRIVSIEPATKGRGKTSIVRLMKEFSQAAPS